MDWTMRCINLKSSNDSRKDFTVTRMSNGSVTFTFGPRPSPSITYGSIKNIHTIPQSPTLRKETSILIILLVTVWSMLPKSLWYGFCLKSSLSPFQLSIRQLLRTRLIISQVRLEWLQRAVQFIRRKLMQVLCRFNLLFIRERIQLYFRRLLLLILFRIFRGTFDEAFWSGLA